jgi:nitroreductase
MELKDVINLHPALALMVLRRSYKVLGEPHPSNKELEICALAANAAPDHRRAQGYRFHALSKTRVKTLIGQLELAGPEHEGTVIKLRRTPMLIGVILSPNRDSKTVLAEQRDAAIAATENFLLALTALGYGASWQTGRLLSDPLVSEALGVKQDESLIATIFTGTPSTNQAPERNLTAPIGID